VRKDTVLSSRNLAFLLINKKNYKAKFFTNLIKKINKDNFGRGKTHEEKPYSN
jgi:hypothetical protein